MKKGHLFLLTFLFVLCTSISPHRILATSWAYFFVVWDGYIYETTDEPVTEIGDKIGQVTKYSDMEQYSGNFSNAYEKGTKYYEIKGISTDTAIAVEESKGTYSKAYRKGEYEYTRAFDGQQGTMIFIFSILGMVAFVLIYKVLKNKWIKGTR